MERVYYIIHLLLCLIYVLHIIVDVYRKKPECIKNLVLTTASSILWKSLNISLHTCVGMIMTLFGISVT